MKRLLPLIIAIPVLFLSGCTKGVLSPDRQYMDISGSWYLSETMQKSPGSGWTYYRTGLEKGVFTFYRNGTARYEDGYNIMTGNWDLLDLSDGYYDRYGNYYYRPHTGFNMHVYDSYTNNTIDLYFDDIVVSGNNIFATSYNGHTITRYVFDRY
jgi:hypothetical protein